MPPYFLHETLRNNIVLFPYRHRRTNKMISNTYGPAPATAPCATDGTESQRNPRLFCVGRVAIALLCGGLALGLAGCGTGNKLPNKSSKEYAEAVSAFYIGLGALQVGDDIHADSKLSELTTLVPGEPAGWANWGVLALRQRKLDVAAATDRASTQTCS